jgi:hypothetical protein
MVGPKSSGSETTFPEDLTHPVQIEAGVICDGRRCLSLVRESERSWPDRHGEDQMGRLLVVHS